MNSGHGLRRWTWAHRVTAASFLTLLVLGRSDAFPWVKGSLGGTTLFEAIPLVDPLAALEMLFAAGRWTGTVALGAGLLLVFYALLGRAFCGWLCPLGLLLDLWDDVRRRIQRLLQRRKTALPELELPRPTKYWVLGLLLGIAAVGHVPVFSTTSPINVLVLGVMFGFGVELSALAALLVFESFFPRGFCRSLCPIGALYSLWGRMALLKIRVNPGRAGRYLCRLCTRNCPMGIRVMEDWTTRGRPSVDDPECTRCGTCIDQCFGDVLSLGWRMPSAPPSAAEGRAAAARPPRPCGEPQLRDPIGS